MWVLETYSLVETEQPCQPQVPLLCSYSSLLSLHFHQYLKARVSPASNFLFNWNHVFITWKMILLVIFIYVSLVTLCWHETLFFVYGTTIVVVKNSRAPVNRTEGQPLSLKCTAEYEEKLCGNIRVSWGLMVSSGCHQLTDSDRYLIHINETKTGWNRQQDAFISFTRLTLNDTGLYQCSAVCQHNRTTAIGRGISVTVTGMNFVINSLNLLQLQQKLVNNFRIPACLCKNNASNNNFRGSVHCKSYSIWVCT